MIEDGYQAWLTFNCITAWNDRTQLLFRDPDNLGGCKLVLNTVNADIEDNFRRYAKSPPNDVPRIETGVPPVTGP